jgi:hypothetical protein
VRIGFAVRIRSFYWQPFACANGALLSSLPAGDGSRFRGRAARVQHPFFKVSENASRFSKTCKFQKSLSFVHFIV